MSHINVIKKVTFTECLLCTKHCFNNIIPCSANENTEPSGNLPKTARCVWRVQDQNLSLARVQTLCMEVGDSEQDPGPTGRGWHPPGPGVS